MKARKAIEKIKAKHDLRSAVKEALDTLPSAVCYFTPAGTVKLCNTAMYELYRKITQSDLQSLAELNEALEGCDHTTGVIRDGNVFLFPDGHAWQYSAEKVTTAQGEVYTEVIFDDVTELYEKQQELKCQSRELKNMYRELKVLSDNVLEMTREQEILNLKTRLHDQMNMGVAAIRQILRQNTTSEENAAAVRQFRRAIQVLREENVYLRDDVSEFIRDAEVSGVRVEINGDLPTEAKLYKVLLAVMREACINAARHADATAMYVVSEQTETAVTLHITNNGRQPEGDITPRGRACVSGKTDHESRRQDGDTVAAGIFADGYFAGWRRKTGTGGAGMTRVLVVDDQRIAREYMENVVRGSEGYELVGSLTKADMAATVCRRSAVELVLMDVCTHGSMDGIEAAAELREQFPKLKIIIVTSMPEESFIKRAKEVGADSFWHKEASPEELITVMDATMQGKHMWPGESPIVKLGVTTSTDFTETEIKVLRMVCEGLEYSEIAEELHYTKDNVKYHIRNILQKTGYANKTQLAIAVTGKRFIIPKLFDEQDGSEENPIVL